MLLAHPDCTQSNTLLFRGTANICDVGIAVTGPIRAYGSNILSLTDTPCLGLSVVGSPVEVAIAAQVVHNKRCCAVCCRLCCRQLLLQQLTQAGVPLSSVRIYSSPFSRTLETARAAAAAAGIESGTCMHVSWVGTLPKVERISTRVLRLCCQFLEDSGVSKGCSSSCWLKNMLACEQGQDTIMLMSNPVNENVGWECMVLPAQRAGEGDTSCGHSCHLDVVLVPVPA